MYLGWFVVSGVAFALAPSFLEIIIMASLSLRPIQILCWGILDLREIVNL